MITYKDVLSHPDNVALLDIEEEIKWTQEQLKNCHFTEFEMKGILRAHINYLRDLQMKKLSQIITKLYRHEKQKEVDFINFGMQEDLS